MITRKLRDYFFLNYNLFLLGARHFHKVELRCKKKMMTDEKDYASLHSLAYLGYYKKDMEYCFQYFSLLAETHNVRRSTVVWFLKPLLIDPLYNLKQYSIVQMRANKLVKYIKDDESLSEIYSYLAISNYNLGLYEEALSACEKLNLLVPDNPKKAEVEKYMKLIERKIKELSN